MGGALFDCPILHCRRNCVRNFRMQASPLVDTLFQGTVNVLGKPFPHLLVAEYQMCIRDRFIWCRLPDGVDMMEFCTNAVKNKVALVPGTAFNADEDAPSQCFRMNYSTPTDEQIVEGMRILGGLTKNF